MNKKSGHWQNTGLAKWISDNLYQYNTSDEKSMNPMKWYSIQNGGNLNDTRETINGFPCRLILINDGETPLNEGQNEPTPGNVKDMGIFNFNNDKGNTDTFGLDNSIFPQCASYEVVANSDTSAGAFVPYKHTYSIATSSKNITANLSLTNAIPFSNLPEFPWTITSFTRGIEFFKIDGSIPSTIISVRPGETKTVEQPGSNTIMFRIGSGDTGAIAKFSINNNIYEIDRTGADTNILQKTTEADELAYLQDSFELRYPDDKEVGADYGMLGMDIDNSGTLNSEYGLKRVIDWVGNATDEEFVANFEQYFNKEYTFRYYLLVITLGMVDNLGGRSCRV